MFDGWLVVGEGEEIRKYSDTGSLLVLLAIIARDGAGYRAHVRVGDQVAEYFCEDKDALQAFVETLLELSS